MKLFYRDIFKHLCINNYKYSTIIVAVLIIFLNLLGDQIVQLFKKISNFDILSVKKYVYITHIKNYTSILKKIL